MPDRLRALRRFSYAGRAYVAGDVFIASAPDAKALVAGNTPAAERYDENDVPALLAPKQTLNEAAAEVVGVEPAKVEPTEPKRKRGRPRKNTYDTREMRAKE